MFFWIALHDNLTLSLRFLSRLNHDNFFIFTTLIYEPSHVKLACTNQTFFCVLIIITAVVDWKFNIISNPPHTFIIKAFFELLIEWLFYVEGPWCLLYWFIISWDFLAVAYELNSDLLLWVSDIELDLFYNKAHFYGLLPEGFLHIAFATFSNGDLNFAIFVVLVLFLLLFIVVLLCLTLTILFLLLLGLLCHVFCSIRGLGLNSILQTLQVVEPIERHLLWFGAK